MTQTTDNQPDLDLKARHRVMWTLGDYPAVATEIIPSLGPVLVEACGIKADHRVLDVAAGAGNAAIPAARTGADVVASDLTPELLAVGHRAAQAQGVDLEWVEGDAESLPFPDADFDVVMSCVGVMFAPRHGTAADELVRVCRPGGTVGVLSWTPEGFIGQMLAAMKPFAPPPPVGAQPPPLWGQEQHVRDLLGDRVSGLSARRRTLAVDQFVDADAFGDYFRAHYGPTIAVYRAIADDPDKVAGLDAALVELVHRFDLGGEGATRLEWEYLLVTAQRS